MDKKIQKIVYKEIPFIIVMLVILSISLIPATFGLMIVFEPTQKAEALVGSDIGLEIQSIPIKCVQDELSPTCYETCQFCGSLAEICNGAFEVKARYLWGVNLLHQSVALCVSQPTPPLQGTFRPGSRCKGKMIYAGLHTLYNFGCYP